MVVSAEGVQATLNVTIVLGPLKQITITPASVTLKPNGVMVFRATGGDIFNNRGSIRPLWHTVGGVGTIDKRTGLFRAGTRTGTGYVIAYADSIFGDAGARRKVVAGDASASLSGVAKVVVEQELPTVYALSL